MQAHYGRNQEITDGNVASMAGSTRVSDVVICIDTKVAFTISKIRATNPRDKNFAKKSGSIYKSDSSCGLGDLVGSLSFSAVEGSWSGTSSTASINDSSRYWLVKLDGRVMYQGVGEIEACGMEGCYF